MVIDDHMNLMGTNPLVGPNEDRFGPRFPDMTEVYSSRLRGIADQAGRAAGLLLPHGTYIALLGPSYETPAEIRYLRTIGGDAVGMSTVPEAIAAHWAGLQVCGVSLVTNPGAGYAAPPNHEEVLAAAESAGPRLADVLERFIATLADTGPAIG